MKTAIIDIDGTLADCRHRLHHLSGSGPQDWDAFFADMEDDPVIEPVLDLARAIGDRHGIVLCTGRSELYREATERWLDAANVPRDALYMRATGDHRPDHVIKSQLLDGIIADGYEPFVVIDDRQSVVDMWRERGLICLQCAPSDTVVPDTARLTLMVGPTGAGKSSWLQWDGSRTHHPSHVISSDQTRADLYGDFRHQGHNDNVYAAIHAVVKCRLRNGLPTVVDATNIRTKDRVGLAKLMNVPVEYIVLNRSETDKRRDGGWRNTLDIDLISRHENTFRSNERAILAGDGLANVTVTDLRQKPALSMRLAA